MVLLELLLSFIKIGFASFGGATMVPLINAEMLSHSWMTVSEVADIVAIAEMTPGPLGTNCATFAGMRVAGIAGALAANLGVLAPSFTLTVAAGFFFERFKGNRVLEGALGGIRPVNVGLVLAVMISMGIQNYTSWQAAAIGAVAALILWKTKLSIPLVVLISAALGIAIVR